MICKMNSSACDVEEQLAKWSIEAVKVHTGTGCRHSKQEEGTVILGLVFASLDQLCISCLDTRG